MANILFPDDAKNDRLGSLWVVVILSCKEKESEKHEENDPRLRFADRKMAIFKPTPFTLNE